MPDGQLTRIPQSPPPQVSAEPDRGSSRRGLGRHGLTFKTFAAEQRPQPTWRSLKLGRNPVTLLNEALAVPLIQAALDRIDSYGRDDRNYPLSVIVRWLFMLPLCNLRCLEHMADRMLTDEQVRWAVLGDPEQLSEEVRSGIAPSRSYVSKQISDHLDTLIKQLQHLYDSMIAALLRWDPSLKYGLIYDGSMIPTWGNPERAEYARDEQTGRWKKTGRILPATDPDAWNWSRKKKRRGDGDTGSGDGGFGYRLSALPFCKHPVPLSVSLGAPRPGNGERLVALRMLNEARAKFGPLLALDKGELAVFIADAGLASKESYSELRALGYEPVMPYNFETKEDLILPDTKLITRKDGKPLALDVRRDGTPLCPHTDWPKTDHEGGRRPLEPLPSDLTARAQRWRCPMKAVGECPNPCALEPQYTDESLRSRTEYPRVKKLIAKGDQTDGYRYVLFPRISAEARTLMSFRGRVEHDFSYIKGRGCFGGDGEDTSPNQNPGKAPAPPSLHPDPARRARANPARRRNAQRATRQLVRRGRGPAARHRRLRRNQLP